MNEKCTLCGTETLVPIDKHVDYRLYYVEGAGQLCKSCWDKVYSKKVDDEEDASIAQ